MSPDDLSGLLDRFRSGRRLGLARAISMVEGERPGFTDLLDQVLAVGPRAHRLGVTGPPGAGKSSLVARLAAAYRKAGDPVGIVAVDPTSPYSGGALLGDRIRMNDLATDPEIFIRSMATRGSLGGLAVTTGEVIDLMDAFGFPRVLVETVGVGQTELEITGATDTVVVVLVPESGDSIQAMKAGLMEIGDIFVVNKADRPGADRLVKEVRLALHLGAGEALRDVPAHHGVKLERPRRPDPGPGRPDSEEPDPDPDPVPEGPAWEVPVLKTVAQNGDGIPELIDAIHSHGNHLQSSGELVGRRRRRAELRIREVVDRELGRRAWADPESTRVLTDGLARVERGEDTAYGVAHAIVERLLD